MQYQTIEEFTLHAIQQSLPIESAMDFLQNELTNCKPQMKWGTIFFATKGKKPKNICYLMEDHGTLKLGFPHGWLMMQQGYFDESDHAQVRYLTLRDEMFENEEDLEILKSLLLESQEV